MAEKRVSVRLSAVGGRQMRAELEDNGDAGARGFGRLSSEMEMANTRLVGFARKAGIALAAVTAAAAAAGVAMIRSGLDTIGAQADMAASLKTTVESLQVLTWAGELAGVSMGEIEQATKKLTTRLSEAAAGSGSAVGALQRLNLTAAELQALPLDQRIVAIQDALARFVPEAERAAVASDLFGDKAALAFLRIDPATLREAAQDMRDFGVAVSDTDAAEMNRIANWSPSVSTTITTEGLPITSVGTVATPTLAATNLAASTRRWRLTSAVTIDAAADQRSAGWACWRGNAAGLCGWTFVTRISLTTLQASGMGFFGLYGSTAALATTLTLATVVNCVGIGFQRGTHANWQMVTNDGTEAPTLTDMGAGFAIATGGVLTLYIAAAPNAYSVRVRVVNEGSGVVFEAEITSARCAI